MLKRIFVVLSVALLLANCSLRHQEQDKKKPAPKVPVRVSVTQRTPDFTKVKVTGDIDVYLHTGVKYTKIVFQGESEDIANVSRVVNNEKLYVEVGRGYPKYGRIKIDIYMHNFTGFEFHGSGSIFAKGVTGNCIDLDIDNNQNTLFDGAFGIKSAKFRNVGYTKVRGIRGCATNLMLTENAKVKLIGHSNVATIDMRGNSELTLYWVRSKTMRVQMHNNARARISGLAEQLHAETWDRSWLDSRHLMSQTSFVKTHGLSEAYIAVVKNQHTLASDKSNIYYYYLPETKSDFMAKEGSVLDMREWKRPFLRPHHKYNR